MASRWDWSDDEDDELELVQRIRPLTLGGFLRKLAHVASSAAAPARPAERPGTDPHGGGGSGLKDIARYLTEGEVAQIRRALDARRRRRASPAS